MVGYRENLTPFLILSGVIFFNFEKCAIFSLERKEIIIRGSDIRNHLDELAARYLMWLLLFQGD